MIKKVSAIIIFFTIFIFPKVIYAEGSKYIEIFDSRQNRVVKVVQLNTEINNMVIDWLKEINGIYSKVEPVKDDGYVIRIPLNTPINVQSRWLNSLVKEVYIIIQENEPPIFMIFESENKLICFPFTDDIMTLSKVLNYKLK